MNLISLWDSWFHWFTKCTCKTTFPKGGKKNMLRRMEKTSTLMKFQYEYSGLWCLHSAWMKSSITAPHAFHFMCECLRNPALRATLLQALWHFLAVLSQALFYITTASLSTVYLCFCYYKCQIANQTQERQLESWQWPAGRSAISVEIWGALHFCFLELDLLKKTWVEISAHCYVVARALLCPSISYFYLCGFCLNAVKML